MKVKYILILWISFFMLASCEDMLEEHPKDLTIESFYNNAEEIETGLFGCYRRLEKAFDINLFFIPECQVDYGYSRSSYASLSTFQPFDVQQQSRITESWHEFYKTIDHANLVIIYAPNASDATEVERNALIAEAKFLRAFSYFYLVRLWGAVPLKTDKNRRVEVNNTVKLNQHVPVSPVDDIYEFILSDLEFAEANLPENQSLMGRPTKMAVKTFLTHVYLELQRWPDARTKAKEVIDSQKYSLVPVSTSDDFYNIFGVEVNGTSEEIFYIKYNRNAGNGNRFAIYGHGKGNPYLKGKGYYGVYTDSVQNKVIREWDYKDLRKSFNLYNWNIGLGSTTMQYKKYIDPDIVNSTTTGHDLTVYRYADLLLFYAEADCMVNNGPTADGMEKLNIVHRRAYGHQPTSPSNVDFNVNDFDKDSFMDLIMIERAYEFFYESKRFLDLKRTGRLKETIKEVHGIDIHEATYLWPIPEIEISRNEAIDEQDQNPGY